MQLQSNVSTWFDDTEDDARAGRPEAPPDLADVLSEIEARPQTQPERDQARTVRRRIHIGDQTNKLVRVSDRLRDSLGRQPTDDEIGEELGLTTDEVEALRQTSRDTISLETPIGEEGDTELGHLIEDATAESPATAALESDLKDQVDDVLSTLEPRERRVIQLRFGLTDGHQRALDQVARRLGTSRETVRP